MTSQNRTIRYEESMRKWLKSTIKNKQTNKQTNKKKNVLTIIIIPWFKKLLLKKWHLSTATHDHKSKWVLRKRKYYKMRWKFPLRRRMIFSTSSDIFKYHPSPNNVRFLKIAATGPLLFGAKIWRECRFTLLSV